MGADGRRPASGGAPYGRVQVKRRAGIWFLRCVGAPVGEVWMEKVAAAEIDTGGRSSRAATRASIGAHGSLRVRLGTRISS
jgi:hypothetical protein